MNILSFDLNLLKVLHALLQEGSTVRAADRVGLSQPAVSAALGRLRAGLEDPLFVREGLGLVPTPFAESLREQLEEALQSVEELIVRRERFDPSRATRDFRLACSDYFGELLMPEIARRILPETPGLRFQILNADSDDAFEHLLAQRSEIALQPIRHVPPWAECHHLHDVRYRVYAREGHPLIAEAGLAAGDTIPGNVYAAAEHALFSTEGSFETATDALLARHGFRRRVVMALPVFSVVAHAVAGSDLLALIPIRLGERVSGRLGLVAYEPPVDLPGPPLGMFWHRRMTNDPAHTWLRDTIAAHLADGGKARPLQARGGRAIP